MPRLLALLVFTLSACDTETRCSADADCPAQQRCVRFNVGDEQMGSACFQLCGDEPRACANGAVCIACREAPSSCTLDDGRASGPYCSPP
jgi:hypothetical protein